MEDLLWGCHSARVSLRAEVRGTANRAEVGKTQLRVPVRKGEREEDSIGGTWREDMKVKKAQQTSRVCVCALAGIPPLDTNLGVPTWCLGDNYHIAREPNITGCSTLKWDGGALEVAEHVHHRGEVQVLHTTLSTFCEH